MKRAIEPPKKHPFADADDLLGKNRTRSKCRTSGDQTSTEAEPVRKRTEDLGDSL